MLAIDHASDIDFGGVLMQDSEEGTDQPISFFSKKFDKHQRNFSTIARRNVVLCFDIAAFCFTFSYHSNPLLSKHFRRPTLNCCMLSSIHTPGLS